MKIGTLGCSNSSDLVGDSWPVVLGNRLNCEIIQWASIGSGNEALMVEKLCTMVQHKPDFIIIQLSGISRCTMSLNGLQRRINYKDDAMSGHHWEGQGYYTFNIHDNIPSLKNWINMNWTKEQDDNLFKFLVTDYNMEFKIFHTLSTIQSIGIYSSIPIYIWSWFDDIGHILDKYPKWKPLINTNNMMMGRPISDVLYENFGRNSEYIAPCHHWYRPAHEFITDSFLLPFLKEKGAIS